MCELNSSAKRLRNQCAHSFCCLETCTNLPVLSVAQSASCATVVVDHTMAQQQLKAKLNYKPCSSIEVFYSGGAVSLSTNGHVACACQDDIKVVLRGAASNDTKRCQPNSDT